jgi:hypothetical protein
MKKCQESRLELEIKPAVFIEYSSEELRKLAHGILDLTGGRGMLRSILPKSKSIIPGDTIEITRDGKNQQPVFIRVVNRTIHVE